MAKMELPLYRRWYRRGDDDLRRQMDALSDAEAAAAFAAVPTFGTGGIRRLDGVGSDRVNDITVTWVISALSVTLSECPAAIAGEGKNILIAYDTRRHSRRYAEIAAALLAKAGFHVGIFPTATPVPMLSFALRQRNARCGVMITASHNPAAYNGIKVYDGNGVQLLPAAASAIEAQMKAIDPFSLLPGADNAMAGAATVGDDVCRGYIDACSRPPAATTLKIAATPLGGSAGTLLREVLGRSGHTVFAIAEDADPTFGGLAAPNPEDPATFATVTDLGEDVGADLILAVDGDGDRCGCRVATEKGYATLNGNETAAILLFYLCERGFFPDKSFLVRTAVSGVLGEKIAAAHGIPTVVTPTGFKYIGAALTAADDDDGTFFAGYEESGGFLYGDHAADKDGIATAALVAEAASYYRTKGETLIDVLAAIHRRFGREDTLTERYEFADAGGAAAATACLRRLRHQPPAGSTVTANGDTLTFTFSPKAKTALRPSGTEPLLKVYYLVCGDSEAENTALLTKMRVAFHGEIEASRS